MTRKILMNDYHVLPNAIVGGNFWVLNWWLNQIERWKNIFEDFSKWRREETWLTFLHLTHTWLIDFLLKKACAMGLITVSVSSQWKASTCLPCISLCKSCVVLCCAQWVYVFKRYHNTIGPSPTSTFPFSEVAIIHIDMTML